jgi:hypothetical protein
LVSNGAPWVRPECSRSLTLHQHPLLCSNWYLEGNPSRVTAVNTCYEHWKPASVS